MGESRLGPLATVVVVLLLGSGLGPALLAAAAPTLAPDTVVRGTLSALNDRDDYNFTVDPGEWAVVAANNYQGTGAFHHGLRTDITSKNPIVRTTIGTLRDTRSSGVIAINGHTLVSPMTYTVSEELSAYSPSYALQLRTGMTTLAHSSRTVSGSMGPDSIVLGFEIDLMKRDTIDLRLRIPPEWTYNYDFALLLFSPVDRYHQWEGMGGSAPVAVSAAGENSEQALTHVVTDAGTHLIVLLNLGLPDNIKFELEVGINGLPLDDGDIDEETLTRVNQEDYYSFIAPTDTWSAAVVKARGVVDRPFLHSLHWPTPDSNEMAMDEVTADSPAGILAINGRELGLSDIYYVREQYHPGGSKVSFTVQFAEATDTLPSVNATTPGSLSDTDIFVMYELFLQASQTVDLRLRVGSTYNYDHDLGLYVFPPGDKYYSVSGERPEYASGPISMSRNGLNSEQDVVFTSPMAGAYAVVIVNFAPRDNIPFTLDSTIQGRGLADDVPLVGDLNEFNREDLYQFRADMGTWNLVGCRLTTEGGTLDHRLHSTALDTNFLREEEVGVVPVVGGRKGETTFNQIGLLLVDGNQLSTDTTYFVREEVVSGEPSYVLELEKSPRTLGAAFDNLTASFKASEFLHTYVLDLDERDTVDLRVAVPPEYTYPYQLGVYVFAPGSRYRNLGTEGDVGAMAVPGERGNPSLVYTASMAGDHLVVVANLGEMEALDYELTYAVNGFPTSAVDLNTGTLDADNAQDALRFDARVGQYTLVVVRLSDPAPAAPMTATLRWPTIDSVALSTLRLTAKDRVGAFVIDGNSLPAGSTRHYVHLEATVPEGRALDYQVQIAGSLGSPQSSTSNLTEREVGALYTPSMTKGSTIDISLRVPPDYTYGYDLGLYLFGPDETYMSTTSLEAGPRAVSRYGPGTEQEIVYTSRTTAELAVVVINHATLGDLSYVMRATVDGQPLDAPRRAYVDAYNRAEQYRYSVPANQWSVLASRYISGGGSYDLKALTNGLSTNPVAVARITPDSTTGVIAINGWSLTGPSQIMYGNVTHAKDSRSHFVVHAATNATDFGPIGHVESAQFQEDEIAYVFLIDLTVSDHLELQLAYDKGNWSSDVILDLLVFEPLQEVGTSPVKTVTLKVEEGRTLSNGAGEFLASKTGVHGLVLVNRGPLGPLGFSLGVYRRSIINQPPMYPAILKTSSSEDTITVEWAPNQESDFDRYEIWLSTSFEDPGHKRDTIPEQSRSRFTIDGLDAGHKYWVYVVVYDDQGLYTASNPVAVKTKDLPIYMEPLLWVVVLALVAVAVIIVVIYRVLVRQRIKTAAEPSPASAMAGAPEAPELEVEGIEDEEIRPERETRRRSDRQVAIDYATRMMGDED